MEHSILKADLKKSFDLKTLAHDAKFHFIALGGIGMSALARILLEAGYKISGSDLTKNHLMEYFEQQNADIFVGHSDKNLIDCAVVVKSSAIKLNNPELQKALELNIPVLHRAELLNALMRGLNQIAIGVTGTHGKTTTTGMITTIFYEMGLDPSFAIGGEIPQLKTNSAFGKGGYFISELDESDGTIELYSPDISVITNLELEHTDHYRNGFDQLLDTMARFVKNISDNAKTIINIDDAGNLKLIDKVNSGNFITYSLEDQSADYFAEVVEPAPNAKMKVYKKAQCLGEITLGIPGVHNLSDALAATAVCLEKELDFNGISNALSKFTGMKKRFQTVGFAKEARIIDDYAHHPTEIKATVKTARQVVDLSKNDKGNLIAVFQPHRYTRFEKFWGEFLKSFDEADIVYVCDVYSAEEAPLENINSEEFAKQLQHKCAYYIKGDMDKVADTLINAIKPNDLVLTMGAGNITKLGPIIVNKINGNN
ncbi:MAG TPA: UDP-N-acetylmuramate--L-alanine ligase [Candidatus Gastranaerophilales bacterium]|nr:UDP-N-acetylmuramate--L-alanine ligase [Candidatus Gastranaerophilales bacterium]